MQGNNKVNPININKLCTLNCIYLEPSVKVKDSYNLLYLQIYRVVIYRIVKPLPMTDSIIC